MSSRRAAAITAILGFFTGILITDGYTAYQQMLDDLTGIQQCAAHYPGNPVMPAMHTDCRDASDFLMPVPA
jgi:hypothetical protein